jgi:hypothetical protein
LLRFFSSAFWKALEPINPKNINSLPKISKISWNGANNQAGFKRHQRRVTALYSEKSMKFPMDLFVSCSQNQAPPHTFLSGNHRLRGT